MPEITDPTRVDLYDKLYGDLVACALSAIPVDPDDHTTFIRAEGDSRIWGSPQVVAAAVASATYTVMGIRLDEAFAAGRTAAASEPPEPCPLEHRCDDDSPCGCWCDLHDVRMDECPTFGLVAAWLADAERRGRTAAAADIRARAAMCEGEQFWHFEMCARVAEARPNPYPPTRQDIAADRIAEGTDR